MKFKYRRLTPSLSEAVLPEDSLGSSLDSQSASSSDEDNNNNDDGN